MKINLQNNEEFDNFFKKKYTNDTIKPSEELWKNINHELKAKSIYSNFRNISRLKIAVSVLAIALVGTVTYFEIAIQNTKFNSADTLSSTQKTLNKNNKHVLIDSINQNSTIDIGHKNNNEIITINEKSTNTKTNTSPNIDFKKDGWTSTNNIVYNKHLSDTISFYNQSNRFNSDSLKKNIFIVEKDNSTTQNKFITYNNYSNQDSKINTVSISGDDNSINTIITAIQNKTINKDSLEKNEFTVETDNLNIIIDSILVNRELPDTPLNNSGKSENKINKFSIELNFTPRYSYRTLANNPEYYNPDIGKSYFNKREKGDFSFSTGIQLIDKLNDKWKISAGIEYAQYSQKMKITSYDLKTDNNGYYLYTSLGKNSLTITSSTPINNTDFLKSSTIYSFINIPITAEYSLTENFFINGGLVYNLQFAENIDWQAEDYNGDFSISTNNITGIKTSNLSFTIGAGYEKTIGHQLALVLNPQLTTFFTSLTSEIPVKTYPYSLGVKLGLRYIL